MDNVFFTAVIVDINETKIVTDINLSNLIKKIETESKIPNVKINIFDLENKKILCIKQGEPIKYSAKYNVEFNYPLATSKDIINAISCYKNTKRLKDIQGNNLLKIDQAMDRFYARPEVSKLHNRITTAISKLPIKFDYTIVQIGNGIVEFNRFISKESALEYKELKQKGFLRRLETSKRFYMKQLNAGNSILVPVVMEEVKKSYLEINTTIIEITIDEENLIRKNIFPQTLIDKF